MTFRRRMFDWLTAPYAAAFRRANRVNVLLSERSQPIFEARLNGTTVRFHCTNAMTLWRAQTLLTKEPDTIEWINGFAAGDLLFDIGANVGTYSIYAGSRGTRVYAFEPEAQNYAALNRNIHLNDLQERVVAYNFALGRSTKLDILFLSSFGIGHALHNLGGPQGFDGRDFKPAFKQGVAAFSLDDLVYARGMPVPQHVKIDVDGLEPEIVAGAARLLTDMRMRSVLVELDTRVDAHMQVVRTLEDAAFRVVSRYHSPAFEATEFKDIFNYIFRRD